MKRLSICAIIIAMGIFASAKNTYAQSFYDINTVQTIAIMFTQTNWDYLLDTAKMGSDGYIMAQSVTINGTKYDSVGVKFKGNSTYSPTSAKNPFHIELDTYKDQDYQGYTDIKLSNVAKDPSYLREVLSYFILRQYMDASLSNYANVFVNGTLLGLYVSSESVGKRFVNSHFYSKDKAFFKCNPLEGAVPGTTAFPNLVYLGTDSASYAPAYEINSDYGWKDLINLCYTLKNNISEIESVLDVDRALWMIAFDNVIVNLDSYIGQFAQNYYLYKDDTGRFNCVLWDFNESFGTFSMTGTINLPTTVSKSQMTHLLHSSDANWPLIKNLLAIPTYRKMYLAHLQTIVSENFGNNSYITTAQLIQSVINTAVQADPNKFFTYAQYQSNLTTDVNAGIGPGGTSAPGITSLMSGRNTYLSALSDLTNTKPTISNVAPSNTNPQLNSSLFITANVVNTNAASVYLGYRFNVAHKFTKVLMYDDGANGDGNSGDNIYGASISVTSALMQYYIYAENTNAGMFSPARAEHEFYTLNATTSPVTTGNIVMNEIYARGTTTDPDWVEIYNSSDTTINVGGYKIYDVGGQSGSKNKKEFPIGTLISSKSVFVIVTDGTTASAFGLSNSGEKVWLENALGTIIDTITFLGHTAAQSYGRMPDGGPWQILNTITRGKSNASETGVQDKSIAPNEFKLKQNYPNPFNSSTDLSYYLPDQTQVEVLIYNSNGELVRRLFSGTQGTGEHQIRWDVRNDHGELVSGGVYIYQLRAGNQTVQKKMVFIK